ncbi:MAG: aminotransferase class I/II-fold pyridoxal phosphate-dependent enzyme [Timaviella obliquedivisa GSE-PSE-MK23-08B]|nr:aminotransferase class I/II-fold pyridoxal phosphate-dependent enzyme [Timaviella obliquedivisa GSE-PSE-MK23-08B]
MTLISQTTAPLLEALQVAVDHPHAAFHTPGHKHGKGAPEKLKVLLGAAVFKADLPELPELDNLFAPEGAILQAQVLAAAAFGAEQTWFLANGTTCGIEAAVLATCNPGEKLILPRNAHQAVIAALILSGAVPIFVEPAYDSNWGIAHSLTAAAVATTLEQHPDAKAVMIVYPTYYGACGEIEAIAQITHHYHIPLLVDEAHGAHFVFHTHFPISALAAGADIAVQSTHKVLAALTQASMLHVQGCRIDRQRLSRALQLVQSTSPSYLLLASLDAARQQMATQGQALMSRTLELADRARTQISQIPRLSVLQPAGSTAGCGAFDPTRLTVDVTQMGLTGFEADEILHQALGVTAELPGLQHLMFIVTLGNTEQDIDRLINGFKKLADRASTEGAIGRIEIRPFPPIASTKSPLTPRSAFFAKAETLLIEQTPNRISAELVCPYPPGIPVLFPGEVVTEGAIAYLQQVMAAGGTVTGCADRHLHTLNVVAA